jgi:hypothetical protein
MAVLQRPIARYEITLYGRCKSCPKIVMRQFPQTLLSGWFFSAGGGKKKFFIHAQKRNRFRR